MVRALLDSGANVNAKGKQYSSALHAAAVGSHVAVVKLLLEAGADVNIISETYGSSLQVLAVKATLNWRAFSWKATQIYVSLTARTEHRFTTQPEVVTKL